MDKELIIAIQKLIESGALDNLQQTPGTQTLIIYGLLILLATMSFRVFIINGWLKRGVEKFFTLEERKLQKTEELVKCVLELQTEVKEEHRRLSDVMNMLHAQRKHDREA